VLPTKFWFIWLLGFRGEYFLETNQLETKIACGEAKGLELDSQNRLRLPICLKKMNLNFHNNWII
jgi:hypothetical protein